MTLFKAIVRRLQTRTLAPAAAYDLWAATYDDQPANVVFHLDDLVFTRLLGAIDLRNKTVVDIGCGTGRHWPQLLQQQPASLTGYDVSAEMLKRLQRRFPEAQAWQLSGTALKHAADASTDVVISTLALAHIADPAVALTEWNRILKHNADIIFTDFHPAALELGADRTFRHNGQVISVENHVHAIEEIRRLTRTLNWTEAEFIERAIDDTVKHFYEEQNALSVFERFRNTPIIYGLRLKKA